MGHRMSSKHEVERQLLLLVKLVNPLVGVGGVVGCLDVGVKECL